jgi:hypothetical protein
MVWTVACCTLWFGAAALPQASAFGAPTAGELAVRRWEPLELAFEGPWSSEWDDAPNPFLDYRLQVRFTAPSGATFDVPGFFDGDDAGGGVGSTWKVRFSPDEIGGWSYVASFRGGPAVAVDLNPGAGTPLAFDGAAGSFQVGHELPTAPGFLAHGRLEYVGAHYLRFQDGTWFLKTGTNSPENLFGYSGFDGVQDLGGLWQGIVHDYAPHVGDWLPGDPYLGAAGSPNGLKGLIGALNYLSDQGVNSVYFLPMNLGGDGQETAPFLEYQKTWFAKTHYDTSRLAQWNTVLEHAARRGIQVQLVLSETEQDNVNWLDSGTLGFERKLFLRELTARFAHNLALKWNLGEESNFDIPTLVEIADYVRAVDPYDHPICVHTHVDYFDDYWQLIGKPMFDTTSIQYTNTLADQWTEDWRANSAAAGRAWVVDLDENGTPMAGVTDGNADEMRKEVLYDVLFSGGGVEWYLGAPGLPLGGDVSIEDFRTREDMWRYSRIAREFLEQNFAFSEAVPLDEIVVGENQSYGGAEVLARADRDYAIYLPNASWGGGIDLTAIPGGHYWSRWFDPRNGGFAGPVSILQGGGVRPLGAAPSAPDEDWVVLVKRVPLYSDVPTISFSSPGAQKLTLDAGPEHAFETYLMVGSVTGTSPGTTLAGVAVPLNPDLWTLWTLQHPNTPLNPGFAGTLNAAGGSVASFDLSGGFPAGLVGLTFHHAYLAGPGTSPTWASGPVKLKLVP